MTKTLRLCLILCFFLSFIGVKSFAQNCTINAGADRTICPGDAFILTGNINGSINQQPVWTQVSGPAVTVSATTNNNGTVTATVTGYARSQSYTFRLTSQCIDGSPVFDDAVYTVSNLTIANAGSNIKACPGVVTMAANAPAAGETGVWTVSGNLPLPNPATSPNGTITLPATGPTVGTSVYTWTITNSSGSCSTSSNVSVTNLGGEAIFADSPINVSCYSTTAIARLHASFAGIGNGQQGTWSFISGPSVPSFGDIHDNNTGVGNLTAGIYKVRWTVAGQCVNGTADVTINVSAPTQDVTDAGGEPYFTYCDGRTSTVLNGVQPRYANEVVQWTSASTNPAGVTISNATSPTVTLSGLDGHSPYDFVYTITNTVTGCSNTGIYHVRYTTPPSITFITANPAVLPCDASQLIINYDVSGGNRTQWALVSAPAGSQLQANAGINNFTTAADNLQPIVGMNKIGTYIIRFRRYNDDASGGCSDAYKDIAIVVSKSPYQANAGTSQLLACGTTSATLAGNAPLADDAGNGQWTQVSGPNTAVIANRSLNNTAISNLTSGVYVFRWIVTGGGADCGNSQSDVSVIVASPPTHVYAGADFTNCYATPVKLNADAPATTEKGTWSIVSESPATPASSITFADINDHNTLVSGLLANKTYTFRWTILNSCGSISDDVAVSTNATAGPKQAAAGTDQCLPSGTTSFTLNGNAPDAGETGIWTLVAGSPNTPAYTNANTQTVTGAVNGTYRFEWQLTKGGCISSRDTVVITTSPPTTQAQINGGTTATDQCGLDPITLNATNAALRPGEVGTWTQTEGPGGVTISSPNGTSTTISGLAEGRYKFRYTITNNACSTSFAEISYNLTDRPTPSNAHVDNISTISLCDATSTALNANVITVGQGLWVVQSGPNSPTFSNLNDPKATISGLILGKYVLTWRSSNGTICSPSETSVTVVVHQSANAGADQNLCNTTTTVLAGNEGSDGTWTLVSALPAGTAPVTISKNGSASGFGNSAIVTGLTPGATYVFRYTINTGTVAGQDAGGCGTLTDDVTVNVSGPPSIANAGADQQICIANTTSVTLAAVAPTVGTGAWSLVSRPIGSVATINNPSSNSTTLDNLTVPGDYLLQWTVSYANCQGNLSSNDIVRISVYSPPTVAQPMTDQLNACVGNVTLTGTTPTSGIGTWTFVPNSSSDTRTPTIDAPNSPITTVSNLVVDPSNPYRFRWTISSGPCTASSADVNVTVKDQTPAVANAGTVSNVCEPSSDTPAAVTLASTNTNLTGNDVGTWTVTAQPSGSPAVTFNNIHNATATASGLIPGAYTFTWTITNNSECTSTSSVSFSVLAAPSQADAGPANASYCLNNPVVLSANTPTAGTGTWTVVYKPSGAADPVFSSVNANNATVSNLIPGNYIFRWTISNGTCADTFDDISITTANCDVDLTVTNSDGKATYIPGTANTYTVVVSNVGSSSANGATVTYPFPNGTSGNWTATFSGGATGTASGTGSIIETVNIPAGGAVTYTVALNIPLTQTGNVTTTATATTPSGSTDPTPANNTATDTDVLTNTVDLSITNTDGKTSYVPGTTNTYTVVATNSGAINVTGAAISYPLPSGVTGSWTATYSGGATGAASGSGSINESVNMPAGSTVTYTVTANVPTTQTGNLTTTATITAPAGIIDSTPANNTATDVDAINNSVDLSITQTVSNPTPPANTNVTFTITANNNGPLTASNVNVTDLLPSGYTFVSATPSVGTYNSTNGNWNIGNMTNGASNTLTIIATVNPTGNYTNTATIGSSNTESNTNNNTSQAAVNPQSPPVANNDAAATPANTPVTINLISNDTQSSGNLNPASVTITQQPQHGTVTVDPSTGVATYTPNAGYTGPDTFTYTVKDVNGGTSNVATANITIDKAPQANNDNAATNPNSPVNLTLLTNDVNGDGTIVPSTVTVVQQPQNGKVTINPTTGVATYTPNNGYTGTDAFTYTVKDSNGATSNVATATITINKGPQANDDSAVTGQNTPVNITVLNNDVSSNSTLVPSTVTVIQQPLHGTVSINLTTGVATYTPNAGYSGTDNFTYTVKDANGATSNIANVTITIPQGPAAVNDNATTTPNTPVQIDIPANDTPGSAPLDPTTVTIISQPAHGTVVLDPSTGRVTYVPSTNYTGTDQFTYTIKDQNGNTSNVATVNIAITDKPVIGLAKSLTTIAKNLNGSYDVTYTFTVGNYGVTDLTNISVKDDLRPTFPSEQFQVKSIRTLGRLQVNVNYDGNSNAELLASGNPLVRNQVERIEMVVNVTVLTGGATYLNRAYASGTSVTGATTTDQSTDGLQPDPDVNGNVSPSNPTPVVLSRPTIKIPEGFSPNGDGAHDKFVIEGTSGRRVSLEFYNRWGNLVYRNNSYQNDWDGKTNQGIHIGDDLPEGTYYYIIRIDDTDKYVGFITLKRQ
ncbi:Ig-like domain-containing protein [Mucilaginibacter sp. KACC 22063]|uniref:Ig-like domain-containing protein n=1 Tax=Mucilaginibacter sp. KACC 22063 TaxID=3025666 RepID=UPI0023663FB6|nr:Ig-like domain-containing protein [Mucilaginibacter sp. KACC 22063]WDF53340.1 Ig-like domain-containing protein [Mucilaginibacter sp. KACC 22063]